MKKQMTASILTVSAILLTACASNPTATTAIQKENNQFEVTGIGKTSLIAKNNAVDAANKTCKRGTAVVIDEKNSYNGVVDEETGKIVEAAAGVIGSITGKNTSLAKDNDYQTTLTFYCKKN